MSKEASAEDLFAASEGQGPDEPSGPAPTLALDEPPADIYHRPRGESDRALRVRYSELKRARLVGDPVLEAAAREDAVEWLKKVMPTVKLERLNPIGEYNAGNVAALARFRDLDPRFTGRGYEVELRLPDGRSFQPDGIQFLDHAGHLFRFLESKEPYTTSVEALYFSKVGERKLWVMLQRDATIAEQLHPYGCQGFAYATGHPKLDEFVARAIEDMRRRGVPGAEHLQPPTGL